MGNRFFRCFLDCSNDLGLILREDVKEIRGAVGLDKYAMKIALSMVNLCTNMKDVRHGATSSAMNFIRSLTNDEYNVNNMLRKRGKFICTQDSDDEEGEIPDRKKRGWNLAFTMKNLHR